MEIRTLVRECCYTLSTAVLPVCLRKQNETKYSHVLYFTKDHHFLLVHRTKGKSTFSDKITNIHTSVKYRPFSYFLNLLFNRPGFCSFWLESHMQAIHWVLFSIYLKKIQPFTPKRTIPPHHSPC